MGKSDSDVLVDKPEAPADDRDDSEIKELARVKREEILNRDDHTCVKCGSKDNLIAKSICMEKFGARDLLSLHNTNFITLCNGCVAEVTKQHEEISNFVSGAFSDVRYNGWGLVNSLHQLLIAFEVAGPEDKHVEHILSAISLYWSHDKEVGEVREEYEGSE